MVEGSLFGDFTTKSTSFAKRAKFPKFKKKFWDQSAVFTKNAFVFRDGKITLAKQKEPLNIKWSRHFTGEPSSLTITKERSGRYYISILVEEEISPLPFVRKEIGIDLGLSHTISDHEGNKENPSHFLKNTLKQLKRKQQSLARKRVGSANWKKAKKVVGTLFAKIRDRRVDFLHQLSWRLVNENQVIAAETLNVKGMMKNRCLAQRIGDAGWGTLLRFLDYKSAWYGRMFVQIDQFFPSSKECSHCGALHKELRLEERTWQCLQCQTLHDRDVNAARNILKEGLKKLGVPWGTRDLKPAEFV